MLISVERAYSSFRASGPCRGKGTSAEANSETLGERRLAVQPQLNHSCSPNAAKLVQSVAHLQRGAGRAQRTVAPSCRQGAGTWL